MPVRHTIDQFLHVKAAANPSWSSDGRRVAFATNITGTMQVWSVEREGGWPQQLTFFSDRVMQAEFSPSAQTLILHK